MADGPQNDNTKRSRSVPPDVTVTVGSGSTAQSFPCYKLALCFASPYFDTMLSSGMSEESTNTISLPHKNPEEWKEFYKIIDPSQIGEVRSSGLIDECNAVTLTSWFHEFSMENHLKECDEVLAEKAEELSHWDDKDRGRFLPIWKSISFRRREDFSQLIDLLEHACKYDLSGTIREVELTIGSLLKNNLQDCQALFDVDVIGRLVLLCLPVTRSNARFVSEGACKNLWQNHFSSFLARHRTSITVDMVNNNEMFPLLLHSYMQHAALLEVTRLSDQDRAARRDIPSRPSLLGRFRERGSPGIDRTNRLPREHRESAIPRHFELESSDSGSSDALRMHDFPDSPSSDHRSIYSSDSSNSSEEPRGDRHVYLEEADGDSSSISTNASFFES